MTEFELEVMTNLINLLNEARTEANRLSLKPRAALDEAIHDVVLLAIDLRQEA